MKRISSSLVYRSIPFTSLKIDLMIDWSSKNTPSLVFAMSSIAFILPPFFFFFLPLSLPLDEPLEEEPLLLEPESLPESLPEPLPESEPEPEPLS